MRLIDADALQRRICGAKCGCEYEDCDNEGDCLFDHFIFHAPTIDAEPVKHGRWLLEREPNGKPYCFHCSACDGDFAYIGITTVYNYCPNCGAKMDEE